MATPNKTIRLTSNSYALLAIIDKLGEASAYDVKRELAEVVNTFWPVPHTTVYQESMRLYRHGLLASQQEEAGRHRRTFRLTKSGSEALRGWIEEGPSKPPQILDEGLLKRYAGAHIEGIVEDRLAWHQERVAELRDADSDAVLNRRPHI
jgi:PadR family transcriptional regulator AphA